MDVVTLGAERLQLVIGQPFGEFIGADLVDLAERLAEGQG